jgi:hypothetical protein
VGTITTTPGIPISPSPGHRARSLIEVHGPYEFSNPGIRIYILLVPER